MGTSYKKKPKKKKSLNKVYSRPFNNKKRTKGRQKQEIIKKSYLNTFNRFKYINSLINKMIKNKDILTEDNWLKIIRKYDINKLYYTNYEKQLIINNVNNS